MKSTILLYGENDSTGEFKLTAEKSYVVEGLAHYLAPFLLTSFEDVQHINHKVNLEVKLNFDQSIFYPHTNVYYRYCAIKNDDESVYTYYFITSYSWLSKSAIKLFLYQDTLNSYDHFSRLDKRTRVIREHKDRFKLSSVAALFSFQIVNKINNEGRYILGGDFTTEVNLDSRVTNANSILVEQYTRDGGVFIASNKVNKIMISGGSITLRTYLTSSLYSDITQTASAYIANGYFYVFKKTDLVTYDNESAVIANLLGYVKTAQTYTLRRLIHRPSEGIDVNLINKGKEVVSDLSNVDWYLVYNSGETESEPIEGYILPGGELPLGVTSSKPTLLPEDVPNWNYTQDGMYYTPFLTITSSFNIANNVMGTITTTSGEKLTINMTAVPFSNSFWSIEKPDGVTDSFRLSQIEVFDKRIAPGTKLFANPSYILPNVGGRGNLMKRIVNQYSVVRIEFENVTTSLLYLGLKGTRVGATNTYYAFEPFTLANPKIFTSGEVISLSNPATINDLNRSLYTIVKAVKLPYCPFTLKKNAAGLYVLPSSVEINSNDFIRLKDVIKISSAIGEFRAEISITDFYDDMIVTLSPGTNDLRNDELESKLLHSDFSFKKFAYDSFSYVIRRELIGDYIPQEQTIIYKQTSTINSKMLFDFSEFYHPIAANEDYPAVLLASRNNDITLFNNAYLNYIKTGYNYDLKNKERQAITSFIGAGVGALSTGATLAASIATGGATLPLAVTSAATTVSSLTGAINSVINADEALKQKITQLKSQSVGVSGADDIDLLSYYNGNRLQIISYDVDDDVKKALGDLFYYCGYKTNEMKIPDVSTRKYFNFLQAEPHFASVPGWTDEVLADITAHYQQGLTFLHYVDGWDFEQIKENYESWIN